jgi:hypothetical protein
MDGAQLRKHLSSSGSSTTCDRDNDTDKAIAKTAASHPKHDEFTHAEYPAWALFRASIIQGNETNEC